MFHVYIQISMRKAGKLGLQCTYPFCYRKNRNTTAFSRLIIYCLNQYYFNSPPPIFKFITTTPSLVLGHHILDLFDIVSEHLLHSPLQRGCGGRASRAGPDHLDLHYAWLLVEWNEFHVSAVFLHGWSDPVGDYLFYEADQLRIVCIIFIGFYIVGHVHRKPSSVRIGRLFSKNSAIIF